MDVFARNSDIPRTITLTDGTDDLDTDGFLTIEVKVRHKKWNTLMGTYTLAGGTVTKESPTTDGQISIYIPPADNEDKPVGVYVYQVTTTETDADYTGSVRTRRLVPEDCFYLKKEL